MAARTDIKAGAAYVELYVNRSAFVRGLRDARRRLQTFSSEMLSVGRQMAVVSAALLLPLALGAKTFADFDDAMRQVGAVTGSTEEEMSRLRDTAKLLGRTTSFTAVEVGNLMAELGRAGFAANQIDVMTGSVLSLARATGTDATQSAGIMSAAIRQFGLDASDADRVADGLTAAANKSFNTVEGLGEALKFAGPVARDFNLSFEDTLALLGGLGNVGIQGTNAGTAVRRLLTVTGAEAEKLQGIFGVAFKDAAGDARPLVDVMGEIDEATKDLGSADRAKKFNEAFGLLGITGASAISRSTGDVKELAEAIKNAGGEAARTAEEMDAGLGGSFRILLSAVEGVRLALGEAIADPLADIVQVGTEMLGVVTELIENNQDAVQTFGKWAAVLGVTGAAIMAIGAAAGVASFAIGGLSSIVSLVTGTFAVLGTVVAGVWAVMTSPVTLVIIAIAGIAAAALQASGGIETLVGTGMSLFGRLKDVVTDTFGSIWDALKAGDLALAGQVAMKGLQLAVAIGLEEISEMFGGVFGDAIATFGAQLTGGDFAGAWETAVLGMGAVWSAFTNGIVETFVGAAAAVVETWERTVNSLTNYILQKAGSSDFFAAAFEKVSGVNVKEELERERRLNAQAESMGLNSESSDLFDDIRNGTFEGADTAATAESMRQALLAAMESSNAAAAEAADEFASNVAGGSSEQVSRVDQLRAELNAMKSEAEAKRASVEAGREDGEGGGGAAGALVAGSRTTIATFSAAAAIAQSQSSPQSRMAERQADAAEKQLKKSDHLLGAFNDFSTFLKTAWPVHQ